MKRRLVTPQEILSLHYQGVHCLEIPPDAIITPGARDLIMALDFRIAHGPPSSAAAGGSAEATVCGQTSEQVCDGLCDQVRGLVEELAPQLTPEQREQVIRAVLAELGEQR